jgi:hypothetical protein
MTKSHEQTAQLPSKEGRQQIVREQTKGAENFWDE